MLAWLSKGVTLVTTLSDGNNSMAFCFCFCFFLVLFLCLLFFFFCFSVFFPPSEPSFRGNRVCFTGLICLTFLSCRQVNLKLWQIGKDFILVLFQCSKICKAFIFVLLGCVQIFFITSMFKYHMSANVCQHIFSLSFSES